MKTARIFFAIGCLLWSVCKSQSKVLKPPTIGQRFANFALDSSENYNKSVISDADFNGKWILLDFWGENCSSCIASFPKIDLLQKKYVKDIQFVLVTSAKKDPKRAKALFNRLRSKLDLSIPVTYDQDFVDRVGPIGLPTIVVINPNGFVEAITNSISETDIIEFLAGRKPKLPRSYLSHESKASDNYNSGMPLLIGNNGGAESNYLYRSVITQWVPTMSGSSTLIRRNRFEVIKADLKSLYRLAYLGVNSWYPSDTTLYGKYNFIPILELKDSSQFEVDRITGKNLYCFSLSFSDDIINDKSFDQYILRDKPRFQKIMQKELENYFGFSVKIEERVMPVCKLVSTKEARENLKTKGGAEIFEQPNGYKSLIGRNISVSSLRSKIINSPVGYPYSSMPLIDETGIMGNIDIKIDAIYFEDWLKELRKNGLDLVIGEKVMKVLVIRDPKPEYE